MALTSVGALSLDPLPQLTHQDATLPARHCRDAVRLVGDEDEAIAALKSMLDEMTLRLHGAELAASEILSWVAQHQIAREYAALVVVIGLRQRTRWHHTMIFNATWNDRMRSVP